MDVAAGGVGDLPVTLVIKAPSQRQDDQVVDCVLSWTVRKLKEHLETVYPSKPKSNEQRLIYSGKLLQDDKTLKDVLRQFDSDASDNRYTLHLVCSSIDGSKSAKKSETADGKKAKPTTQSGRVTSSGSTPTSGAAATLAGADGLRYRATPQAPTGPPSSGYPGANNYAGFAPSAYNPYATDSSGFAAAAAHAQTFGYSQEQYALYMQQMYSQYMMQYMQYYQQGYNPMGVPPSPLPYMQQPYPAYPGPWAHPGVAAPQPEPLNEGAAPAANNQAQAARPGVRRMNAQGGVEEDEDDGEPRDWLHHTYTIMRFLTFLGILFFYSNFSRFFIVFTGSVLIFALQKLRKYYQERNRENQQAEEEAAAPEQAANAEAAGDGPTENTSPEENNSSPTEQQANEQNQEQANQGNRLTRALIFAANTLQAFVTSLLPTPPDLLEAAN